MATAYQTPGVYVEWLDKSAQQLVVGRTDVAGFVGLAERGPLHTAVKIESDRQFFSTFGDVTRGRLPGLRRGRLLRERRAHLLGGAGGRPRRRASRASVRLARPGRATAASSRPPARARWGNDIEIEAAVDRRPRSPASSRRVPDRPAQRLDFDPRAAARSRRARANLLRVRRRGAAGDSGERHRPARRCRQRRRAAGGRSSCARPRPARPARRRRRIGRRLDARPSHRRPRRRRPPAGVAALDRIDGVSFVAVPDLWAPAPGLGAPGVPPVRRRRDPRCPDRAHQRAACAAADRMALLDCRPTPAMRSLQHRHGRCADTQRRRRLPPVDRRRAIRCAISGLVRFVPPSGHVAGMFARTDRLRGVHKPPANEVVEGACDAARARSTTPAHGRLNDAGVNAIRAVPGRGVLVLGARTLSSDYRWRYVNVRRLFTMIEEALDDQMQWAVVRAQQPAVCGATSTAPCAASSSGSTARACSTARRRRRPTSCAATTPPIRRADTDAGPRDLRGRRAAAVSGRVRRRAHRRDAQRHPGRGTGGPGCLRPGPGSTRSPSFRFTVTFDDLPPGGFSDCTGLQAETEVQEYAEGGLQHPHLAAARPLEAEQRHA